MVIGFKENVGVDISLTLDPTYEPSTPKLYSSKR